MSAPKLTVAQRRTLARAAGRADGNAVMACGLRGSSQEAHLRALKAMGFIARGLTQSGREVLTYVITDAGRVALHCDNGLQCIATGTIVGSPIRSCICICVGCTLAGRAVLRGES